MKHFTVILAMLIAQLVTAQESNDIQILEDVKISIEMGSFDDLEILDSDELISLFDYAKPNQPIELEIICNFDRQIDDLTISGTSLKINGNTNNLDEFTRKAKQAQEELKELFKSKE